MQELFHKPVPGNGHTNKKTDAARQVGGVVQGGGEEHTGQNRETDRREMERERERERDRHREREGERAGIHSTQPVFSDPNSPNMNENGSGMHI